MACGAEKRSKLRGMKPKKRINYPAASSGVFFDAFEKSLAKLWPAALKNAASCGE